MQIGTNQIDQILFEPRFLNLDWFFNQIYNLIFKILGLIGLIGNDGGFDWSLFFLILKILLILLTLLSIIVIIYSSKRHKEIIEKEEQILEEILAMPQEEIKINEKWQFVLDKVSSMNPSDWKLAILEADNILDEVVRGMGYVGEDLGERLKAIEPSDFLNLQNAWDAHKVRNRIAHEGSDFVLTQHEARRVIDLYESVFKEAKFI